MSKKIVNRGQRAEDGGRKARKKSGILVVISGPSGSGKTTLAQRLLQDKALKNKLKKSISFTTRPRRSSERENRDYLFITEEEFRNKLRAKKILEWTRYLGYYYGTPREFVDKELSKGRNILLCVDLRGVAALRRLYPKNCVAIFIMPPSLNELRARIEKRCDKIARDELRNRLNLAKKEVLSAGKFDHCLVNKNLSDTAGQLQRIVLNEIKLSKNETAAR